MLVFFHFMEGVVKIPEWSLSFVFTFFFIHFGFKLELKLDLSTRHGYNLKIPEFSGGWLGKHAEAWLEGMNRWFTLNEYASSSKARMSIFQLKGDSLNWWLYLEKQLHLTPLTVSWKLFEERFNMKYLSSYYREQ